MPDMDVFGVERVPFFSGRAVRLISLEELPHRETLGDLDRRIELAVREKECDEIVAGRVRQPAAFEKLEVFLNAKFLAFGFLLAPGVEAPLVLLAVVAEDNPIPALLQFEGSHIDALSMPFCPDFVPTKQGELGR